MPDRLAALLGSATLNGIDFVEITSAAQTSLRVHFLNTVAVEPTLAGASPVTITGGESVPSVPVEPITAADWGFDDAGRPTLELRTPFPGDFSFYRLAISSTALDAYYASARFTFKAGCPSDLDCAPAGQCDLPPGGGPVIDYLAKDYASLRAALLDYSASAYPQWVERDEADLGMMLLELLSAVGDDLSYLQDRIANERAFATATQRNSVVRHARLVDYEPRPATSAQALVQIDVSSASVPAGMTVLAPQPDGSSLSFELGSGLLDPDTAGLAGGPLGVDPRWNRWDHAAAPPLARIRPYWWDDSQSCLPAGSCELWVRGHGFGFPVGDPQLGTTGLAILLDTEAASPADPPTRAVVHLTGAVEEFDQLYGIALTRLSWDATEALAAEHALERTVLAGNLVPAVEGRRYTETFVIDPEPDSPDAPRAAVTRSGPDAGCADPAPMHLHTLLQGRLAWLAGADGSWTPEACLVEQPADTGDLPRAWRWRRSLLDAGVFEPAYTIDPVAYRDIRVERSSGLPWFDYDGDGGDSVRFGDGTFGERPPTGAAFELTYRVTAGQAGNVAAGSITGVPDAVAGVILSAVNPFPAAGGAAEETLEHVRASAPQAFRARQFRAVRAEDYERTAEELDWVLDAGASMRWTGSWLSVFATVQPRAAERLSTREHAQLIQLLGRRRIAGYEVFTPAPRYVGLDLIVVVCAHSWALRGEVAAGVLAELGSGRLRDGRAGFFAPGQLRFDSRLERSELEAAIQRAPGVEGVVSVSYRRRGYVPDFVPMPEVVAVGREEIIRVDNNPSRPDSGSIRVVVEGGK